MITAVSEIRLARSSRERLKRALDLREAIRALPPGRQRVPESDAGPTHAGDIHIRTAALRQMGKKQEALVELRRALTVKEGNSTDFDNCGLEAGNLADQNLRLQFCQRAVRITPVEFWAPLNLADCLSKLGRAAEADEAFERFVARFPKPRALATYLDHLVRQGRVGEGREVLDRLRSTTLTDLMSISRYRVALKAHWAELGLEREEFIDRLREMGEALDRMTAVGPDQSQHLASQFAWVASAFGDLREADLSARYWVRATELPLEEAVALANLAVDLRRMWSFSALAMDIRRIVVERKPTDQLQWRNLLNHASNTGDLDASTILRLIDLPPGRERLDAFKAALGVGPPLESVRQRVAQALRGPLPAVPELPAEAVSEEKEPLDIEEARRRLGVA